MKRVFVLAVAGLCLALAAAPAFAIGVAPGVFGGLSYPIVQDDVKSGTMVGLRASVALVPLVTVEPFYASSSLGDAEETFGGITYTRTGFDGTAFGVNAILGDPTGMGFRFFPYAGIGKFKLERDATDIDEVGYNVGLGVGIGATPKVSLQIRGELNLVKTGDSSRKFANATAGLSYSFLP